MSCENNGVLIVRQHVFNLFPEPASSHFHRLGKLIYPSLPCYDPAIAPQPRMLKLKSSLQDWR